MMANRIPEDLLIVYRKTIPEKLEKIKQLIEQVKKHPAIEELSALRFDLHKLAGNSGVYGYEKVCQICKETENKLNAYIEKLPNTAPDSIWIDELDQLYTEIKKGFENPK